MAFDLSAITQGAPPRGRLGIIHGTPGVGKTTFCAAAERPIFLRTEDGLGDIDVPTFPIAKTFDDIMKAIEALCGEHDFQTLVIDSLSALEPMVAAHVCAEHDVASIEGIGYGKGYVFMQDHWSKMLKALQYLTHTKNMDVLLIAHTEIIKFSPPDQDPYNRYDIELDKRPRAMFLKHADFAGFAHVPVHVVRTQDEAKQDRAGKAKVKAGRKLRLVETPAIVAKSRQPQSSAIVEEINLVWSELPAIVQLYGE